MHVVFVANLTRPAASEAGPLAAAIGTTEYETRLALATPAPSILLVTQDRDRAADALAKVRARGHEAHLFDDATMTVSAAMPHVDDFVLEPEGVRRNVDGELLPFGDVFAILRAMHETSEEPDPPIRENVAYFFRRSGARPWILRQLHANYIGLGADLQPVAFQNFLVTLARIREAAAMAVFDDRLVRRRVAERLTGDAALRSSSEGMDLLAHCLALTIASQGGSPYR
jgi:hypothetical protein